MPSIATDPAAPDPRLRTRVYARPYDRVWREARSLLGSLPRAAVTEADARGGVMVAEVRSPVWKFVDEVELRISLDEMGMTRVDMRSAARTGRFDFGVNARRVARLLSALDRRLETATPRA